MLRHIARFLVLAVLGCISAPAQNNLVSDKQTTPQPSDVQAPPKLQIGDLQKRPEMSAGTRLEIIQSINAEYARTRKTFPVGEKDITITPDGKVKPGDDRLYQVALTHGAAARIGDRIQITNVAIHERSIYLEINGGPKKHGHWYQHITIGGMGGAVAPGGADPNQGAITGAAVTLQFKDHVPEMTGPELKQLLDPVFDFSLKTATEVYLETIPPKVKDAIKKHEVLVGMNHDMVVMAKERPPQKLREKDSKGLEYEEWIYGTPPQDVTFVRFVGDEVTQVKIMKVSGEEVLRTEKEVDVRDGVVSLAEATAKSISVASGEDQTPQQSGPPPTLKRPGEEGSPPSTNRTVYPPPNQPRPGDPDPTVGPQRQPIPVPPPVQPPPSY